MADSKVLARSGFGALLRRYRAAANLTQEELAERSGMSAQAVGSLERGARRFTRPSTVEFLADALKLEAAQRAAFVALARGHGHYEQPAASMIPGGPRLDSRKARLILLLMAELGQVCFGSLTLLLAGEAEVNGPSASLEPACRSDRTHTFATRCVLEQLVTDRDGSITDT